MTPANKGFTLIEMLISIAFLATLILLGGSSYNLARNLYTQAKNGADSLSEYIAVERLLRESVHSMLPHNLTLPGVEAQAFFAGSAHKISFEASLPASLGGGVKLIVITIAGDNSKSITVSFIDPVDHKYWGTPQTLTKSANAAFFSYADRQLNIPLKWLSVWPDNTRPPSLIKLQIVAKNGENYPPIVVSTF